MDTNDFTFIESHLDVMLPDVFKEFMRQFPNDAAHSLKNDIDTLQTNAELFVIDQLKFRRLKDDREFDYYELQPDLRDHRFISIGCDGVGNNYFMAGNNPDSNELWFWEHDPYTGLSPFTNDTLSDYLNSQMEYHPPWKPVSQPDPFAATPADGTIVSRANHPHRSILTPIRMKEWQNSIANDADLELDEHHEAVNPFTEEKDIFRRWPGRAKLTFNDCSAHVYYLHGSLDLSSEDRLTQTHKAAMKTIAENLNANVF